MREVRPDCPQSARLVYWGAKGSGKARSLIEIHGRTPEMLRGRLISVDGDGCRTLFFEQRLGGEIPGMVGFTISAVYEGGADRERQLKMLQDADGVVMVIGSQTEEINAAADSLNELRERLGELGRDDKDVPLVLQFNKRDLSPAVPVEEINERLNPDGLPWVVSVATTGEGVREALELALAAIIQRKGSTVDSPYDSLHEVGDQEGSHRGGLEPHLIHYGRRQEQIPELPDNIELYRPGTGWEVPARLVPLPPGDQLATSPETESR